MKKCKSCQSEIDEKATKCPHCQADQRSWFRRHPILTGLLVLFIIGIIGAAGSGGGGNKKTTQPTSQEEKPTEAPVQEIIKTTARELADDFDANQVAAENKWGSKLVEFSAKISNITDAGLAFYNVATNEFSMTQISCKVTDKDQLLPLKNGQVVTVRGIVGKQTMGVIEVNQCEVVK